MDECKQLTDLLKKEMPALKIAYMHRQLLLSQEMDTPISYKSAEKDFNNKYMPAFAEGYKLCYCYTVCSDKDNCNIKESEEKYAKGLEDFLKYFKEKEEKEK